VEQVGEAEADTLGLGHAVELHTSRIA
jgi:hypothetical protein